MGNGSLSNHLFGSGAKKLNWAICRKIAIGIANGLAYLHKGVQVAIIHRDVKASNIHLIVIDQLFEPKLADFGLAKFTPDGLSHTEYSCGWNSSGKKAVISVNGGQALLLTDWAWSLVREGRPLDVIEVGMAMLDPPEVTEIYVWVAVLSM
ncbi:unnamed protein product, partial [Ilex paraguariensis]